MLLKPGQRIFATQERDIEANWKVLLEGSLEGYHIRYAHPETFFPYGFDNLNLIDLYGRSSRVTYPFRRIQKLAEVPPAERKVEGLLTYVYHIFPNVLVTVLSRHTNVVVLEPAGIDRTKQVTWTMANDAGEEALTEAKRDREFVNETGTAEDRALVASIQRGIRSGANDEFIFGHFESAIVHFHSSLRAALAAGV